MGISRSCASKWVNRYRKSGEAGLFDRPSAPRRQPTATDVEVVVKIEKLRRTYKGPRLVSPFESKADGTPISRRTVSRHLLALD